MHWTKGRRLALGCLVVGAIAAPSTPALAASTLAPSPIQKAAPAREIKAPQGAPAHEPASQASTILMTIPGITGEGPGGKIVVQSFQEAQAAPRDRATGQTSGKRQADVVDHQDFVIVKYVDKASPHLATGMHFPAVTLEMRKAGGDPKTAGKQFLTFKFVNVFVSSVRTLGGGGGAQQEEVRLSYQSMQKQ